eukprot:TRINITY_DN423_c1_g1_i1.p1 TRINITY_DN423_c1_g1~~TRINITY_DN423_c1_g1_i1.p1  ORF type:complete len:242 (-),score=73.91 TRINITY_DN423_c1_g1_i1:165-890(-)
MEFNHKTHSLGDHLSSSSEEEAMENENQVEDDHDHDGDDLAEISRPSPLGNIEKEFSEINHNFFSDQIGSLQTELSWIQDGVHVKYLEKTEELEGSSKESRLTAYYWREHQEQMIEQAYEAEKQQVEEEIKEEKRALKERLINVLEEKLRRLEEEKALMNLSDASENLFRRKSRRRPRESVPFSVSTFSSSSSSSSTTPRDLPSNKKRTTLPPNLTSVLLLKEPEISEDVNLLRKNLGAAS